MPVSTWSGEIVTQEGWQPGAVLAGGGGGKEVRALLFLMAHRVVLESSSSFLRIFFLNKNFQAGIGRWEPGPGSDGRGRTCSTSLQVGLSFWNSRWWKFNLQWHDSLPSLNLADFFSNLNQVQRLNMFLLRWSKPEEGWEAGPLLAGGGTHTSLLYSMESDVKGSQVRAICIQKRPWFQKIKKKIYVPVLKRPYLSDYSTDFDKSNAIFSLATVSSFHLFWPLSQEVCFKVKTASEVGQRYFRKFFKKDCSRVRARWLLDAGSDLVTSEGWEPGALPAGKVSTSAKEANDESLTFNWFSLERNTCFTHHLLQGHCSLCGPWFTGKFIFFFDGVYHINLLAFVAWGKAMVAEWNCQVFLHLFAVPILICLF